MKKIFAFILITINALLANSAPIKLVTATNQLWADCNSDGVADDLSILLDSNVGTSWQSSYENEEHYFDVIFSEGLQLQPTESVVVMLRRVDANDAQPTAFEIRGSQDPNSITTAPATKDWPAGFRYAFFTYRGPKTVEYSARIGLPETMIFYRLRFIIKANNSKSFLNGFRYMKMSEFQLYKLQANDSYPDNMADRFHLKTDIHQDYADYELLRTGGIRDPKVRAGINGLNDWVLNNPPIDDNGKWTANLNFYEEYKDQLSAPDYTPVSQKNDSRITVSTVEYQPTHVTEHEIYAIAGDAVALYPFYGFNTIDAYHEVFSHWYNYQTGGNVTDKKGNRVLDFLINPAGVAKSNKYGWFGGSSIKYATAVETSQAYEISTVEDYKQFVEACNAGDVKAAGILKNDLDFTGHTDIEPIGTVDHPFGGTFNGNGHSINNLIINKPNGQGVGVFGWIDTGVIIGNLVVESSCSITGEDFVGFIGACKKTASSIKDVAISNIIFKGTVNGTDDCAGGLMGSVRGSDAYVSFNSCAVTGQINGNIAAGIFAGYLWGSSTYNFINCINTGTGNFKNGNSSRLACQFDGSRVYRQCYTTKEVLETTEEMPRAKLVTEDYLKQESFIAEIGGRWEFNTEGGFPKLKVSTLSTLKFLTESREYGTIATFFYPRDVNQHALQPLDKEYYIAADFSQDVNYDLYFDNDKETIIEPLVNFRHIFHIKDGKKFADDNFSTKEKNEKYIRKNRRHITAEAGRYFQIRLDSPIPVANTTRSRLYYKVTDDGTDYRRVCSMRIRVKKGNTVIKEINEENNLTDSKSFFASEKFTGYGSRVIDGVTYYACGGGSEYYRMLACDADHALEGTYIVQIIGLDYNGEVIKIPDETKAELLIQEFEITFLPSTAAVLVPEADLAKDEYRKVTNQYIITNYTNNKGPRDVIDFDEYMLFNDPTIMPEADRKRYLYVDGSRGTARSKWPVAWKTSSYSFAYNNAHDFNMYQVVSHSDLVAYHDAATSNMTADKNFNVGYGGLFDRKFYDTKGAQKGFYYWVNASADPGVMGYLRLDDFCAGSTVHVTGWIAETSSNVEVANLALNFIAVLKDGDRIPLHTHTTGYVPRSHLGTWMYFYASFVPVFTDKDFDLLNLDHYEIELDNNCKSSTGADYAIDDIRVYLVKPVVYADQKEPICDRNSKPEVKISSPFDVLMQSLGQAPAADAGQGQDLELYYSFVDYKKFTRLINEEKKTSDEAFDEAVLKYKYRGGEQVTRYGKISFNTYFGNNNPYHQAGETLSDHAFRETVNGTNMIAFNTRPQDEQMISGKEYLVVLYLPKTGETIGDSGPTAAQYQIGSIGGINDCSKSCTFRVMASQSIKIDGEVVNPNEIIESCRNQSPVVQVDLYGQFGDKLGIVEKNARFDWFRGSTGDFTNAKYNGTNLWDALSHFREVYPEASEVEGYEPKEPFTQADKEAINHYSSIDPEGKEKPLLLLSQRSFVFPPLVLGPGEDERYEYVLAVPIPVDKEVEGTKYLICTQPTEVRVTVRQRAPRIKHGLNEITYPAAIDDVPLRISLSELQKVSVAEADKEKHNYLLDVPIYYVQSVTENVTAMRLPGGGSPIYIAQTDDPDYKDLKFDDPVGELQMLAAEKGENKITNRFVARFFSDAITFKEGYTYRLRFTFEEDNKGVMTGVVCTGQDVFTIKVVPEYQKWTGAKNLNWNNDDNWRRVSSKELHAGKPSEFTTDGSNTYAGCFAPLDFTKVIIPEGTTFPNLFNETTDKKGDFYWPYQPWENEIAGKATVLVQYDMAQWLKQSTNGVFCRPWYAHTCEQIHFEPRSQIAGQQFLHYQKAWVDMEMQPSQWLTASSPLQGVVAGDMYLPSSTARQETEYFKDINYDAGTNNRFKPAVFQRSWNQASAIVYKFPNHDGDTEDVHVNTTWSHVYNDVSVPYSAGHGFSVRNDLSRFGSTGPAAVLFRLPKADSFYDYYTTDGNTGDNTKISRTNPGRLCFDEKNSAGPLPATIEAATEGNKFFLVGNPFMAHLDMKKFLETNQDVIEKKYWVLTSAQQGAAVMSPDGTLTGSTDGKPEYLPPMTGFFVETKTAGKQLSVSFTADMMAVPSFAAGSNDGATRAANADAGVRITAVESGSTALVLVNPSSSAGYESSEDALFINDSSLGTGAGIFTRADGHAMTVNACPDIEGTEVGVLSADSTTTTLRFNGVDESAGMMLYDVAEETYHPLAEGTEVSIHGAAHNRLYIVGDRMGITDHSITMNLEGRRLTVTSVAGGLTVNIYNALGMMTDADHSADSSASFTLRQGVYLVKATDAKNTVTRKFVVQ